MQFKVNNEIYDVVIIRKRTTRNTYIRVKEDMKIYVTTNTFTLNIFIRDLLEKSYNEIAKMIETQKRKNINNDGFYYLGKRYNIIYKDVRGIKLDEDNCYMKEDYDVDIFYKKEASKLFREKLEENYNKFTRKIPEPTLRIRKMKTRWGVCNVRTHVITLNLELIKRDPKYLNYVIMHELSHLIHGNHSKRFWNLVEENCPGCKKIGKEMKEFL